MFDRHRFSGLDAPKAWQTGLHPTLFVNRDHPLVIIDSRCSVSPFDCVALVQRTLPSVSVIRQERDSGLVDDPVLAGKAPSARFIAHWIVRLMAVEQEIGLTDTIFISTSATYLALPSLHRLQSQGAIVLCLGPSRH